MHSFEDKIDEDESNPDLQAKKPRNIMNISFFILLPTVLCMISLRVSATNLANTNQIENPRGFS